MGLRDIGATLPPGFRFYPSDEELVCHYLHKKIMNEEVLKGTLVEIDLHICEPWQLPEVAKLNANEWYFFSFRDRKYATGFRTNRATTSGYWKATGKDRIVLDPITREIVGMRKTLVFYQNRAPNGIKTGWIMHEFRLETPHVPPKEDWVLCRVFHKSKAEDNTTCMKFSPQYDIFDSTSSYAPNSLNLAPVSSPKSHGYTEVAISLSSITPSQGHSNSTSNSLLNLLQFPDQGHDDQDREEEKKKNDHMDEYGFLWDMNLEENACLENYNNGVMPSNLDETVGFDMENSLVFL